MVGSLLTPPHGATHRLTTSRLVALIALLAILPTTGCTGRSKQGKEITPETVLEDSGIEIKPVQGVEAVLAENARETMKRGELDKALGLYTQLYDRYPKNNEYLFGLATCYRRLNAFQPAIKAYAELLKREPNNIHYQEGSGLALIGTGDLDKAFQYLSHVNSRSPNRWQTLNGMGVIASMKNQHVQALQYYQAALQQNPSYPPILNNTGLTFAIMRDHTKAQQAFELARNQLRGSDNKVMKKQIDLNLSLIYALMGDMDSAEDVAKPHLDKAELYNNMGLYAYLAKDPKMAETYLNMALKDSKVYYERAWKNLERVKKESKGR